MKTSRLSACLLLTLLLLCCLMPAAFAEVVFSSEEGSLTGTYDATVFQAGQDATSNAEVKGILFMAGNTVSAGGTGEYAFIAGNTVAFSGECLNDAFIGGNSVAVSGNVDRDLYAAGKVLDLRGAIGRDLFAGGETVTISGEIGGNVYLNAENIQIADNAKIGGTLRFNDNARVSGPDEILNNAERYADKKEGAEKTDGAEAAPAPVQSTEPGKSTRVFSKIKSALFSYLGLLLIAYFFLWLTPLWEKVDRDYTGKDFGLYAAAFGIGFAVLAGLPLASIILMITGFGLRPAFVLLLVYAAVLTAAPVFLGFFLGSLLWRKALKKTKNYWAELAVGLLVWRILSFIPGVKIVTAFIAGPLALGVITRMLGKKKAEPAPVEEHPALPEQNLA
ncbi:MAG: hypothetical protein K6G66_12115 [Oscillospiraceae bacterium]|nr:hypothetical protein [Oscillospiraceae bacterium]